MQPGNVCDTPGRPNQSLLSLSVDEQVAVHGYRGDPGQARSRHPGSKVPNRPPAHARGRASPGIGSQKSLLGTAASQCRSARRPMYRYLRPTACQIPGRYPGFPTLEGNSSRAFISDRSFLTSPSSHRTDDRPTVLDCLPGSPLLTTVSIALQKRRGRHRIPRILNQAGT